MAKMLIVGVDGSEPSLRAVRLAALEAARRAVPLHIIHAWVWPLYRVQLGAGPEAPPGAGLQAQADRLLADAARVAGEIAPGLAVETSLMTGDASARLVAASRDARLLVVGHRGLGGFTELLLGSVGAAAAVHAHCPVVIVRGADRPTAPVVVGVDTAERSADAIDMAFEAAARRQSAVLAVHSYTIPIGSDSPYVAYWERVQAAEDDALTLLDAALASARKEFPDVDVQVRLGEHPPARELVLASRTAGLVVVGARGSGGFAGMLLGSTTRALIHHADCPVMIERHDEA